MKRSLRVSLTRFRISAFAANSLDLHSSMSSLDRSAIIPSLTSPLSILAQCHFGTALFRHEAFSLGKKKLKLSYSSQHREIRQGSVQYLCADPKSSEYLKW